MSLKELLEIDKGMSVHCKHIKTLVTEIYKTFSGENPSFMKSLFTKRNVSYNLRTSNLLSFPKIKTIRFGLNAFAFRASSLWNQLPDHIKNEKNSEVLQRQTYRKLARIKLFMHNLQMI